MFRIVRALLFISLSYPLQAPSLAAADEPAIQPPSGEEKKRPSGATAAPSEAEQVGQLRRDLEKDRALLAEIEKTLSDPNADFPRAEKAFNEADDKVKAKEKALREPGDPEGSEESAKLRAEIETLAKARDLARKRLDLALEERKTLLARRKTLQEKTQQDQSALDKLTGEAGGPDADPKGEIAPAKVAPEAAADAPPPAKAETTAAPAPGAAEAAPAKATAPASGEKEAGEPAAPAPEGSPAEPAAKKVPEQLVKAQKEARAKEEAAREAEEEAQSVTDRIGALRKTIEEEKRLLGVARKKADLAVESRGVAEEELEKMREEGAPADEIRAVRKRIVEADVALREAREEIRQRTDRIDEWQGRQEALLLEQNARLVKAAEKRQEAEAARKEVESWENPFSPRNLLRWLVTDGPKILAIILGMLIATKLVRLLSSRAVSVIARGSRRGTKEERENRAQTLVGVFINAMRVLIVGGGLVMILPLIGIPIGPILGGAAVVGLAVAFGSQKLIRDYFHGFVILLENQYGVNDVVRIAGIAGLVERISLRMTVLRDLEGTVHFVPNGEITTVSNLTHGWSRAVFDIGIAYKEDVDRVMEVLLALARDLRADPRFAPLILEDPTMLGLDAMADSAVIIKFFIKTRPLKQWDVKRELLRRIKKEFDRLGIEIPFPHRTVYHRYEGDEPRPEGMGDGPPARAE
ncbi:MAG: mechanosensitive ion channel [Planctomycetes bacterium]|nr:mechanosensitive ion channel [Planctomycetota bacterium]